MEGIFQSLRGMRLAVTSRITACLKALVEDRKISKDWRGKEDKWQVV